jgi:hypothetical protein
MSLKKKMLSGAAAIALMGTVASAAPVQVAQDGTGDYLLAPAYYAISDWETKIKVVNTNPDKAVVAKVVIRDSKQCDEIMDFPIYLTPGDVWEGTLKEVNGEVVLVSSDDSMILGGKLGSEVEGGIVINNHHKLRETTSAGCERLNYLGYVEIFGAAAYDPDLIDNGVKDGSWSRCTPLNKKVFYEAVKNGMNLSTGYGYSDVSNDDLMGKVTIYRDNEDVNARRTMMLNLLALENFSEGPVSQGIIGGDTYIANMSTKGQNVVPEVDAALAKERIYIMYEGNGNSVNPIRTHFTIPTKKYWFGEINSMPSAYTSAVANPVCGSDYYYSVNPSGSEVVFRDMEENCETCKKTSEISGGTRESCEIKIHEEIHTFDFNANADGLEEYVFAQGGYIDFGLNNITYNGAVPGGGTGVSFTGMPIVPTTFYANEVRGIYLNNWLYNQFKRPEDVDLH